MEKLPRFRTWQQAWRGRESRPVEGLRITREEDVESGLRKTGTEALLGRESRPEEGLRTTPQEDVDAGLKRTSTQA